MAPRTVNDTQDMAPKNFHGTQDHPWHPRQSIAPKGIYSNEDHPWHQRQSIWHPG